MTEEHAKALQQVMMRNPEDRNAYVWSQLERIVGLEPTIARLTRERDEAVAVAQDKREDLGFSWLGELTEWLNEYPACQCEQLKFNLQGSSSKFLHFASCVSAEWARRIGGLTETQRQVDVAHEEALVEDGQRAGLARLRGEFNAQERWVLDRTTQTVRTHAGRVAMVEAMLAAGLTSDSINCGACGMPGLTCVCLRSAPQTSRGT